MDNFSEFIGCDIGTVRNKLGFWWVLTHSHVNDECGTYVFQRSSARIELHTKNNIVTSEHHNKYAEIYQNTK